jgi:hypothetical protein
VWQTNKEEQKVVQGETLQQAFPFLLSKMDWTKNRLGIESDPLAQ